MSGRIGFIGERVRSGFGPGAPRTQVQIYEDLLGSKRARLDEGYRTMIRAALDDELAFVASQHAAFHDGLAEDPWADAIADAEQRSPGLEARADEEMLQAA